LMLRLNVLLYCVVVLSLNLNLSIIQIHF